MANKQISGLTQKPTPVAATDQFAIDDTSADTWKVTAANLLTYVSTSITGAALTKTDDTNVTLTLGGSPTTALLNAASLTLGWTGLLSSARGGTGVNNGANTITIAGSITTVGKFDTAGGAFDLAFILTGNTSLTLPTTGTVLASSSALTTGSILFSASGVVSQDNSSLFYDVTNHVLGLGTASPNSSARLTMSGTKGVGIYDTTVRNGAISVVQTLIYDSATYGSDGSHGQVGTIFSAPIITVPAGQTLTNFASVISQPIFSGNLGTVDKFAGFIFLAGGTSGATGTLPEMYGAYLETPLAGTAIAALYAGNAAIGYAATSPPASGLIVSGNTSIGSSTATSLFNVGSSNQFQIGTTGIVTSGTWNATVVNPVYGGTGIANASGSTITLGGALSTIGAFASIFRMSAATDVTFPTTGTLLTAAGAVTSATGTDNQITASASVGAVTFSLANGISLGSYQATTPPTGGMIIPGSVSIGADTVADIFNVGTGNAFRVNTNGKLTTTGRITSTTSDIAYSCTGTITALSDGNSYCQIIAPTMNPPTLSGGNIQVSQWNTSFTIPNALVVTEASQLYVSAGSTNLGAGASITTGNGLKIEEPAYGTSKYAATFLGAVRLGTTSQSSFDRLGVLSLKDAQPSLLIGTSTAATTTSVTVSSATQSSSRITLSGQEFYESSNTSTDGLAFLCGVNRSGNRQLWLADSARLTQNTSNPVLRLSIEGSSCTVDSLATDGSTALNMRLQKQGGKLTIGSSVSPTSQVEIYGTASALTDYGILTVQDSSNNGLSIGYDNSANHVWIFGRTVGVNGRAVNINNDIYCQKDPNNISFFSASPSFQSGTAVLFLANRTAVPTGNPSNGVYIYSESAAAKVRGGSGTITTFGPANPHCPNCETDFVHEWENEAYGYLVKCMKCASLGVNSFSTVKGAWDIPE